EEAARRLAEQTRSAAQAEAELGRHADYARLIANANRFWQDSSPTSADEELDSCPANLRGWEWHYSRRRNNPELAFRAAWDQVLAVALSPDGRSLVSGSGDLN